MTLLTAPSTPGPALILNPLHLLFDICSTADSAVDTVTLSRDWGWMWGYWDGLSCPTSKFSSLIGNWNQSKNQTKPNQKGKTLPQTRWSTIPKLNYMYILYPSSKMLTWSLDNYIFIVIASHLFFFYHLFENHPVLSGLESLCYKLRIWSNLPWHWDIHRKCRSFPFWQKLSGSHFSIPYSLWNIGQAFQAWGDYSNGYRSLQNTLDSTWNLRQNMIASVLDNQWLTMLL